MKLTDARNLETAAAPAFAAKLLILGDSTARAARYGAMAGGILHEVDRLGGFQGPVRLGNAGYGGFKLLDHPPAGGALEARFD